MGQTTKSLSSRFKTHCNNAKRGHKGLISKAIYDFGVDAFEVIELFCSDDPDELKRVERQFIDEFGTNVCSDGVGYNSTSGGQGTNGFRWSVDSCERKKVTLPNKLAFEHDAQRLSLADIATKYNVSVSTVRRFLRELQVVHLVPAQVFRNQFVGSWSQQDENLAMVMYLNGISDADIAMKLNRSTTAVAVKLARLRKQRNLPRQYLKKVHQ